MTPPKKTGSKPVSRASSTRSSQPALVPPGEFKRGGSTPKLEPDNGVSIPNSPQIQAGVSGSPGGSEPGSHGNPAGPSNGDPPDSGAVDRPRNLAGSHRGLDSSIHAPQPPGSEVGEPTKPRPKPPSSLCTPQPRSNSTGSAPANPSPRKLSEPNAGSAELQGVNLRGVVPHGQDDPGRLSGHRSVTLQEPRAQPLTLLEVSSVLNRMFKELKKIIDGNSRLIKDRIDLSSTSLLKSLLKDISSPISNNVQIVKDVVNKQFKAVKFSLTGIHTTCNSISSSSTYMTEVLDRLAAKIRAIEDIVRATRPEDLKKGDDDMRNFVQTALDTAVAQVISGLPDNSKVIQVIQEVSARLSSVADQNRAILREIEFSRETAVPDDMVSTLSAVIATHIDKKFAELKLVGSLTATIPPPHISLGAFSVSAEVEQKLEEQSENQRTDFLKLSDKIDRMMSQYRSEGARLREEIAALADSVTKLRQSDQYKQTPPHFPQPEHQSPRYAQEGIDPELKKRLNNAIAKSDWPTFSGNGEYDHLRFVRWIDTAKNDSHIDDEVIVLKLLTMLTGSALSWYETMRLTHQNSTWAFWKAEICKKFGHSAWKQKKQDAFSADKFVPGETTPAQWVTRQYNRLQCFEPGIDQEAINFKLLNLMENEVEYAAKNAMRRPDADLSSFINILEDIFDKTRLGRRRFPPKPSPPPPDH
ncbi:hypothetical protein PTTG_07170 [Puccinia triticina 1-1 BBBD Race 1]|uniref:Uncharacterized protein n=1 Tax=Puccinia triticina (isolate 1-1 / race 1 (BBBD)) TaxID=630390 RepID=A0A180GBK1_PUCT1|nr:hypothetical protein PTTG_07170 [Puccinia triticina 1-1 BBBD Race 1]